MRCPTLSELPPPPAGKTGWPWTEESRKLPDIMANGLPWPSLGIVTPSYNQGQFIEETIRSVLLQGYPNLEYIIMDGGSKDGSVEIIRKYEKWLTHWVSEPDHGPSSAIQSGWQFSTAKVLAYLNSDDTYLSGTMAKAVVVLDNHSDAPAVCGGELRIDRDGYVLQVRQMTSITQWDLLNLISIPQPSTFIRPKLSDFKHL